MHLRELVGVTTRVLSTPFESPSSSGNASEDWKKANGPPAFRKGTKEVPGNDRPVSLTSVPAKAMEQIIPEAPADNERIGR